MNARSLFFAILLIPILAYSQTNEPKRQNRNTWSDKYLFFQKDGKPWAKRYKKTSNPKVVVDTVRMVNGWANITLPGSENLRKFGRHRLKPSDSVSVVPVLTQILSDSTSTLYTYGVTISRDGSRLQIKSSGDSLDDGIVALHILVR